MNEFMGLF